MCAAWHVARSCVREHIDSIIDFERGLGCSIIQDAHPCRVGVTPGFHISHTMIPSISDLGGNRVKQSRNFTTNRIIMGASTITRLPCWCRFLLYNTSSVSLVLQFCSPDPTIFWLPDEQSHSNRATLLPSQFWKPALHAQLKRIDAEATLDVGAPKIAFSSHSSN